jgi:glutamate formiminotransferase
MLFISEARNRAALDLIERSARIDPESVIVNKFEDRVYNRIRFTIVSYVVVDSTGSPIYSPLHQTVLAIVEAAYGAINLELHSGAHPRVGVVDDIAFHPLAEASLDEAAWLAKAVAADIGSRFQGWSKTLTRTIFITLQMLIFHSKQHFFSLENIHHFLIFLS